MSSALQGSSGSFGHGSFLLLGLQGKTAASRLHPSPRSILGAGAAGTGLRPCPEKSGVDLHFFRTQTTFMNPIRFHHQISISVNFL